MIASWIALPIALRLLLLSLLGIALGVAANFAIYQFAWFFRQIGPWTRPDEKAPPRAATDKIPILGWLGLRRESEIHGRGFWIRPMLIEIAMAIGLPAYYWFLTQTGLVLPPAHQNPAGITLFEPALTIAFASHVLMIAIMVAATFIDFDEQTIPDALTIPGTILALGISCLSLNVFLPVVDLAGAIVPITFSLPSPAIAPKWFGPQGWWTAIAIWSMWCFALADRRWITRRGLAKAVEYFLAGLVRDGKWKYLLAMWFVGAVAIRILFSVGGQTWIGLLTALSGLAVGGGVVWAIRIVGRLAMQREAMGFGDVTLMAMIGAFVGWQAAVMAFFMAPMAAIAIVLIYFIITRNAEIPFGPYLCAGALLTIFAWDRLIDGWFQGNLAILGPNMLWLFMALTGIMGVMLYFWRLIKENVFGG